MFLALGCGYRKALCSVYMMASELSVVDHLCLRVIITYLFTSYTHQCIAGVAIDGDM